MTVLLTHGYFIADDPKEQVIMRPYPPLGLLYVAGHLREAGHDVRVYDSTFGSFDGLIEHVDSVRPACLGIYVNLMTRANVVRIMREVRKLPGMASLPIVLGGPETRNHAANFLGAGADVCVVGEGERTMEESIAALSGDRSTLARVDGIAYLDADGATVFTNEREKQRDMSALALPARDLIDLGAYQRAWRQRHGHSTLNVSTMRGCPYTCKWCSRAVYGLSYRRRPVEKVIDELAAIQRDHAPDRIWFVDDVFTISHKWLAEFAEGLERRNLRITFECITRADRMNEEVIALLKRSGCVQVWIGAESGSQRIIDAMDRRVDVRQVREMIRATKRAGIGTGTFIMLGYPGETRADIDETIVHLKDSDPDLFTITVAYPITGTELYQEVEADLSRPLPWELGSDRELDFRREFRRPYYDHAVAHVVNEVEWNKLRLRGRAFSPAAFKRKARSLAGRAGMWWWSRKGHSA